MGIALVLASVLMMSKIYSEKLTRGRDELCEFCDFLKKLNLRTVTFLDTGMDFIEKEELRALGRVGFTEAIRRGVGVREAYLECARGLSISNGDRALLADYFGEYGKADMKTEIERTEKIITALEKRAEHLRAECEKKIKVFTSVTLAVCMGVVILII